MLKYSMLKQISIIFFYL